MHKWQQKFVKDGAQLICYQCNKIKDTDEQRPAQLKKFERSAPRPKQPQKEEPKPKKFAVPKQEK